jgi:hypothetical protein
MHKSEQEWQEYRDAELTAATALLAARGYALADKQPHIEGERYLLSGRKLVLVGTDARGTRCIIKVSSDTAGKEELGREHACRTVLHNLDFAYRPFFSPDELAYFDEGAFRVLATAFVAEEKGFLEHTLEEQFFLALGALKAQEGVQATTYRHARTIKHAFGMARAADYLRDFDAYADTVKTADVEEADAAMKKARAFLVQHQVNIERYADFLTHTDFVPHNLRIGDGYIYLLDHTSLRFGNKYESWGRFVNYMTLYHPALERALVAYVKRNRSMEEYEALRLMRAYKLGFLIAFYAKNLGKTAGDLHELARARVRFWARALEAVLMDEELPKRVVDAYKKERDQLRSEEEKERQKLLKQLA